MVGARQSFGRGYVDRASVFRISLTYGHPYMIDVRDCDARLPSSGDPADMYMDELVRLSVILGRVYKAIYTYVLRVCFFSSACCS